jgi:hypothetical protein
MNSRPTIQQYRRLAEGLLRRALEAPIESKQDLIHHAMSYLTFARAQEQSNGASDESASSDVPTPEETEDCCLQVRQLIKQAIEILLAEAVCHHSDLYSPARLIGRAFPCAADIVGHHHTGAPTMPRPASNGIAIYQINPSSRWAVGPYPCRCRRSQRRSPQRELRPKR